MSWKSANTEISSNTYHNDYQIVGKLDSGGMGKVYLAIKRGPLDTKQLVVLKLPLSSQNKSKWRSEFADEARITSHLNHPNIVRTIDWTDIEGQPCIVSEYIEGFDLRQIIRFYTEENRKVPHYVTAQIMMQTCEAMHYIHNAKTIDNEPLNIVHRDIDPSNIMISDSGYIKIIDFGIAKNEVQEEMTKPGVYKGKFTYLSPDVFLAEKIDQRADIFSVGLVLFELLTGEKPRYFTKKESLSKIIRSIKETNIPAPSTIVPGIPSSFDRIVAKATSLDKADRYATMLELLTDIRKLSRKLMTGADHSYIKRWLDKDLIDLRHKRNLKLNDIRSTQYSISKANLLTAIQSQTIINNPTVKREIRPQPVQLKHQPNDTWLKHPLPSMGIILGLNTLFLLGGLGMMQKPEQIQPVPVIVETAVPVAAEMKPTTVSYANFLLDTPIHHQVISKPKLGKVMPYRPPAVVTAGPVEIERWNKQWAQKTAKKKRSKGIKNTKKKRIVGIRNYKKKRANKKVTWKKRNK